MENLTLQQLINQTKEALIEAGASNYYQNVFKTLTKQLLLYAKEHNTESFSMDFGLQFLEDHYSMSSKIEQKKWCATYSRCAHLLAIEGNEVLILDLLWQSSAFQVKDSPDLYSILKIKRMNLCMLTECFVYSQPASEDMLTGTVSDI